MALYLFIKKSHLIKLIPITLFSVLLLSSFGPWGAFNVSKQSQYARMERALNTYNLLQDGVIVAPAKDSLNIENRQIVSDSIDYLYETHGIDSIQPYFAFDLEEHYREEGGEEKYYYNGYFPSDVLKKAGIMAGTPYLGHTLV